MVPARRHRHQHQRLPPSPSPSLWPSAGTRRVLTVARGAALSTHKDKDAGGESACAQAHSAAAAHTAQAVPQRCARGPTARLSRPATLSRTDDACWAAGGSPSRPRPRPRSAPRRPARFAPPLMLRKYGRVCVRTRLSARAKLHLANSFSRTHYRAPNFCQRH